MDANWLEQELTQIKRATWAANVCITAVEGHSSEVFGHPPHPHHHHHHHHRHHLLDDEDGDG